MTFLLTKKLLLAAAMVITLIAAQAQDNQLGAGEKMVLQRDQLIELRQAPGHYQQLGMGFSFGQNETNESFGFVSGYQINDAWGFGIGVNYDPYPMLTAMPLYVQPRYYLLNNKFGLYTFAELGWSFARLKKGRMEDFHEKDIGGGLMSQLGIGCQFNFERAALTFSLGYKVQRAKGHYELWGLTYPPDDWQNPIYEKQLDIKENFTFKRAVFSMGLTF